MSGSDRPLYVCEVNEFAMDPSTAKPETKIKTYD